MRGDFEEALAQHSVITRRRVKRYKYAFKEIEADLADGEVCIGIIDGGADEFGIGLLVLTQARLIAWQPRSGISEMWLHDIASVQMDEHAGQDMIVVHSRVTVPIVFRIGGVRALDLAPTPRAYVQFVRELNDRARASVNPKVASLPPPAAEPQGSAAEDISRLADLFQQGLLTDEEFAKAKRHVLGS